MKNLNKDELYREINDVAEQFPHWTVNAYFKESTFYLILKELREIKDLLIDIRKK
jgi:hypothetical protein